MKQFLKIINQLENKIVLYKFKVDFHYKGNCALLKRKANEDKKILLELSGWRNFLINANGLTVKERINCFNEVRDVFTCHY